VPGTRDELSVSTVGAESAQSPAGALAPEPTVVPLASPSSSPAATGVAEGKARSSPLLPERASVPATKTTADVKLLIDRGKQFFETGDLVFARILFMRAANAGAAAAVAMGATSEPRRRDAGAKPS
jgi:hypothetical protein